tara:strand:- start:61 stop:273 length:213 start_codon:yes stop_codon:yes gene_type:complete
MRENNYWKITYSLNKTKHVQYVNASYSWYDEEKIKSIYNELNPDYEIVRIEKIDKLEFKKSEDLNDETHS